MAGTINVDTLKADSNLRLQIASANVAFIDANGLTIVGNSLNVGGGRIVVTSNNSISTPTVIGANLVTATGTTALGITANGQITTANAPFILTGGQLQFPATQIASGDGNCLDDYEEGSWTATVAAGGIASQSCRYTKIGRAVTISGSIIYNGASVDPSIGGLPFTAANTYDVAVAVYSSGMEVSSGGPVIAFVLKNSTQLLFYSWVNNSLGSAFQSSGEVSFNCTYFV